MRRRQPRCGGNAAKPDAKESAWFLIFTHITPHDTTSHRLRHDFQALRLSRAAEALMRAADYQPPSSSLSRHAAAAIFIIFHVMPPATHAGAQPLTPSRLFATRRHAIRRHCRRGDAIIDMLSPLFSISRHFAPVIFAADLDGFDAVYFRHSPFRCDVPARCAAACAVCFFVSFRRFR